MQSQKLREIRKLVCKISHFHTQTLQDSFLKLHPLLSLVRSWKTLAIQCRTALTKLVFMYSLGVCQDLSTQLTKTTVDTLPLLKNVVLKILGMELSVQYCIYSTCTYLPGCQDVDVLAIAGGSELSHICLIGARGRRELQRYSPHQYGAGGVDDVILLWRGACVIHCDRTGTVLSP